MENAQAWAHRCYGNVDIGDARLNRRAQAVAAQLALRAGNSVCGTAENWAQAKGSYRFLSNKKVGRESLLAPHMEEVRAECGKAGDYLVIEDTTLLDFTSHQALEDIGWIGDGGGRGLMVHSTLAARIEGWKDDHRPRLCLLGLFDQQVWSREEPPGRTMRESRSQRLERQRESLRWGRVFGQGQVSPPSDCRWTFVADREGDIFEVLSERVAGMDYIIRSNQPRALAQSNDNVHSAVARAPVVCQMQLHLRARPGRKARVAALRVRACQVKVRSPWRPGKPLGQTTHTTWVVEVSEPHAPKGVEPLHWILLTSWDCSTADGALKVIGAYTCRWLIEEYHKALKSGTRIEAAQLQTRHAIENLLGFLAVVAVRLLKAKLEPDGPVENGAFDHDLLVVLSIRSKPPPQGWTNRTVLRAIASQGGFLGRKSDREPGWITIWRGLQHLNDMTIGFKIAQNRCG